MSTTRERIAALSPRVRIAAVFVGFLAITLLAAFHGGCSRELEPGLMLNNSGEEIMKTRDPTSDVTGYLRNGARAAPLEDHHINYWPPGMLLTVFALDVTTGLDAYPRKMIF